MLKISFLDSFFGLQIGSISLTLVEQDSGRESRQGEDERRDDRSVGAVLEVDEPAELLGEGHDRRLVLVHRLEDLVQGGWKEGRMIFLPFFVVN